MHGADYILIAIWGVAELLAYYDPQAEARQRKEIRATYKKAAVKKYAPTPPPEKQQVFDEELAQTIARQERIRKRIQNKEKTIQEIKLEINH